MVSELQQDSHFYPNLKFRHIYILESREWWPVSQSSYDPVNDLVLTYDFSLKHEIDALGGTSFYIDHLCSQDEMQSNNFLAAEFFKKWHYDKNGKDIFTARGFSFGFAFRIEIWSEYLFYVRLYANLEKLHNVNFEKIYLGEKKLFISDILSEIGVPFIELDMNHTLDNKVYFFDIHKYMSDALHGKSLKILVKDTLTNIFSNITYYLDCLFNFRSNRKRIYATIYYPTRSLVECLKKDTSLKVITSSLSVGNGMKNLFSQRMIPVRGGSVQFNTQAESLLNDFRLNRSAMLCLASGKDVSAGAYKIIEQQIQTQVSEALKILDSVIEYVRKQPIHLEVMFANLGLLQTIVDCVLKQNKVPSYLIINGLMSGQFCDEAKYATYINSYSESIKKHYYKDIKNVVCLGDPRMDHYCEESKVGDIQRDIPTVSIGTSGFNNLDLNSYSAVEFEFMFDIMTSFQQLQEEGKIFNLIIKVRTNGVLEQYVEFTEEYFPKLSVDIVQKVSIIDVLYKTDLYISIYSQTLFEASCLGIPVIYYKKDNEILDPPFDSQSEVVTVDTVEAMKQAFLDFQADHDRFNDFLDRKVMEKYIGPLDGKNLERNLEFVYKLINSDSVL